MSDILSILSDSDSDSRSSVNLFETALEKSHNIIVSDTDSDITVDLQEIDTNCPINDLKDPLSENVHGVINIHSISESSAPATNAVMSHIVNDSGRIKETEYAHVVSDTDSDSSVHLLKNTTYSRKHASSANNTGSNKRKHTRSTPNISKTGHCQKGKISDSDSDEVEQMPSRGMKRAAPSESGDVKKKKTNERQVIGTRLPVKVADTRPICKYGTNCYRKNPVHFHEFRHPGTDEGRHGEDCSPPTKKMKSPNTSSSPASATHPSATSRPLNTATRPSATSRSGNTAAHPSAPSRPLNTPRDVVLDAQPLSFLLTKVAGISRTHNTRLAVSLKDILSPSLGNLQKSVQFNYMFDIPWLLSQYPAEFRKKPLLLVHGFQRREKTDIDVAASEYDNIRLCQARLEIMYGTHHSKMMLLLYDSGMRIVIHTANLVQGDWHQKSQGVWVSPVFPTLPAGSGPRDGDSKTGFKRDMLEYLRAYKQHHLEEWIRIIGGHDMSSSQVCIVASVPGRHTGATKAMFGHLKLRKTLEQLGPDPGSTRGWPVIGQFSSIGSLGATKDTWLCKEWLQSLAAGRRMGLGLEMTSSPLLLVYPSKDTVRESLEGYPAGGSLPYSINVAKKQPYLHDFWHHWRSEVRGRTRACPHIKTYTRMSPNCQHLAWFLVTSANLSKAAWGALEKNGSQLMIRSYEIGVLFLPKFFGNADTFRPITAVVTKPDSEEIAFPVPFDLPLQKYSEKERPWVWDIPYVDKPDINGLKWCPPLK